MQTLKNSFDFYIAESEFGLLATYVRTHEELNSWLMVSLYYNPDKQTVYNLQIHNTQ